MPRPDTNLLRLAGLVAPRTAVTGESRVIATRPTSCLGSASLDGHQQRVPLLATVVHHDVDMGVALLHPGLRLRGEVLALPAAHDGHQLTARSQQTVEHDERDLAEVVTDDGEVAGDHAERVARLAG